MSQRVKTKKTTSRKRDVIYVVVWVYHGVIDTVEAYRDEATAQARAEFFKQDTNPDYDDIGVVEVEVGMRSPDAQPLETND